MRLPAFDSMIRQVHLLKRFLERYVAYVMYYDDIAEDNQPTTYIELWKGFVDYVDDAHFGSPR